MRKLFKKYFSSVCTPEEFNQIFDFISERKNDLLLNKWLEEQFGKDITSEDDLPAPNRDLLDSIIQKIEHRELERAKKRIGIYRW